MADSNTKDKRIYILDYIKAVCIILVIIQHSEIYSVSGNILLMPFWVAVCVPCFIMVSGFTLSLRFEHRNGCIKKYYESLPRDFIHILIPYTIGACIIAFMKLIFSDDILTIKDILFGYLTGGIGTGGYFIIIYLQLLVIFPIIGRCIQKKGIKGFLIILAINIVFEFVIAILKQNGLQVYDFYKLCSVRYFAIIAVGCYLYFYRNLSVNIWKTILLVIGGGYILAYAYLKIDFPCAPYWQHSNFYICLYLYPIMCFLLNMGKGLSCGSRIERILSIIGKSSLYIFSVQMAWFTNSYSWHLMGLSKEAMCVVDCVICVVAGVLFYYIIEIAIMKKLKVRLRG